MPFSSSILNKKCIIYICLPFFCSKLFLILESPQNLPRIGRKRVEKLGHFLLQPKGRMYYNNYAHWFLYNVQNPWGIIGGTKTETELFLSFCLWGTWEDLFWYQVTTLVLKGQDLFLTQWCFYDKPIVSARHGILASDWLLRVIHFSSTNQMQLYFNVWNLISSSSWNQHVDVYIYQNLW